MFPKNSLRVLSHLVAAPVDYYIRRQRRLLQPQADSLTSRDRMQLESYFAPEVLDSVRIIVADPLPIPDPPFASIMRHFRFDFPSPSLTEAITVDNVIACRSGLNASLLFHEMVHVVQYRTLGVEEFARQYVCGFLGTRSYSEIPLERSAFDLQSRFETDIRPFDAEFEIRLHLRRT